MLEEQGLEMPRDSDGKPFVPNEMPNFDDDELGFSMFKEGCEEVNLKNMTLPRSFFGRSLLSKIDFTNSILSESKFCWNDIVECNFTEADLSRCDMRASLFQNCNFVGARL